MNQVLQALINHLKADPTLVALVNGNIFPVRPINNAPYPVLAVSFVGPQGQRHITSNGKRRYSEYYTVNFISACDISTDEPGAFTRAQQIDLRLRDYLETPYNWRFFPPNPPYLHADILEIGPPPTDINSYWKLNIHAMVRVYRIIAHRIRA